VCFVLLEYLCVLGSRVRARPRHGVLAQLLLLQAQFQLLLRLLKAGDLLYILTQVELVDRGLNPVLLSYLEKGV